MNIVYELLDQGLLDCHGDRCGRVDDIVIEDCLDRPPRVTALVSGNGAEARLVGKSAHRLSVLVHRLLGVRGPIEPCVVPWSCVAHMNAHVRLTVPAAALGLDRINRAVADRFIGRIPGARQ